LLPEELLPCYCGPLGKQEKGRTRKGNKGGERAQVAERKEPKLKQEL